MAIKRGVWVGVAATLTFGAAALGACGTDTSQWDPTSACKLVASSICESNANCAVEAGEIKPADRASVVSSCIAGSMMGLDCSKVTATVGNPNDCESKVVRLPCKDYVANTGLPLPGSCQSLFE